MDAKELMKMARKARQKCLCTIFALCRRRGAAGRKRQGLYRLQYRKRQLRLNLLRGTQRHICGSWRR